MAADAVESPEESQEVTGGSMHISNEKKLAARATELGKSAGADAFGELAELVRSESPLVRRLAASALGKLSGIVPAGEAVRALHPLLQDGHPQVRQYSAKALGAFGAAAKEALPDLRDLYKSPVEKDYVKRSVAAAGKQIRARSALECADSVGAFRAETLSPHSKAGVARSWSLQDRPDFYLPEFDVYIEYWGMDTADYKIGMLKKQKLYQQQGKKLVSLYPDDKPRMRAVLLGKLEKLK